MLACPVRGAPSRRAMFTPFDRAPLSVGGVASAVSERGPAMNARIRGGPAACVVSSVGTARRAKVGSRLDHLAWGKKTSHSTITRLTAWRAHGRWTVVLHAPSVDRMGSIARVPGVSDAYSVGGAVGSGHHSRWSASPVTRERQRQRRMMMMMMPIGPMPRRRTLVRPAGGNVERSAASSSSMPAPPAATVDLGDRGDVDEVNVRGGGHRAGGNQPMGRAGLTDEGRRWIEAAASEAAVAFIAQVDESETGEGSVDAVKRLAPFLARRAPPAGLEEVCATAGAHLPTANMFFSRAVQRELIRALAEQEKGESRADYRKTPAWRALQGMANRRRNATKKQRRQEEKSEGQRTTVSHAAEPAAGEKTAVSGAASKSEVGKEVQGKVRGTKKGEKAGGQDPKTTRTHTKKNPKQKKRGGGNSERSAGCAKKTVTFENDGGWRRSRKDQLAARIDRYVVHAQAMLAIERETEAASAAAMLFQESESCTWGDDEDLADAVAAFPSDAVAEGTSVGRLGAVMDGLRLVGSTAGPAAGTRLLDFRIVGGGALPPSAIKVGDRVAVAIQPGTPRIKEMLDIDADAVAFDDEVSDPRSYEMEGAVRVLDEGAGEVTLVVEPLAQRRLSSNVNVNGDVVTNSSDDVTDVGNASNNVDRLVQAADEILAGRTLRLVRIPDTVTYERQLAALKTLRNVPFSRTNPPAIDIVRALFAAPRCPPPPSSDEEDGEGTATAVMGIDSDGKSGDGVEGETPLAVESAAVVGFFADAPEAARSVRVREVVAEDLPGLDLTSSGGGALPAGFDAAQALAVRAALAPSIPVTWVQGPPGTGKTGVVIEIIRRAVAGGQRVLACAPSNAAVDNLVERLAALNDAGAGIDFVRVGAPERISNAALESSLDARVARETQGFFDQARGRRRELIDATRRGRSTQERMQQERGTGGIDAGQEEDVAAYLAGLRRNQRALTKAGKKKRAEAERSVMSRAQVVLATAVGAGAEIVQKLPAFDIGVLDEAAQATEPAAWIPLVRCRRAVLVGDPCQLAPLVRSTEGATGGLATSLMARISQPQQAAVPGGAGDPRALLSYGVLGCSLDTQYRSHAEISDWASREMYGGRVAAAETVSSSVLHQLPGVIRTPATATPLLLIDTRTRGGILLAGCEEVSESEMYRRRRGGDESRGEGDESSCSSSSTSLVNEGEAYAVTVHVMSLLKSGVKPRDIAVQSPYAAQVRLIRSKLADAVQSGQAPGADLVEVASVDSFQGREAEAVVVSMVRSNTRQTVGFLADVRRMNVAVTRARRHLTIVGDSATVGSDPFLRRLLVHVRAYGVAVPANESSRLHKPDDADGHPTGGVGPGGDQGIDVV